MNYYVIFYNASGLRVVKHGPFDSLRFAKTFAKELLEERHYRGHQAEVFCKHKRHAVSMGVFYSTKEAA